MRPTSVTVSSEAASAIIPMDWRADNFKVSLGCVISAGANLTYKVQHTFDEIWDASVTPVWLDHATLTGKTANADGTYIAPVRAIRLNVTTWVGGSVTLTVITGE